MEYVYDAGGSFVGSAGILPTGYDSANSPPCSPPMRNGWPPGTAYGSQVVDSKEVLKPVTKWQACLPHVNKMPELVQTAPRWRSVAVPDPYLSSVHGGFREEYTGPDYESNRKLASLPAHRPTPSRDEIDEAIQVLKEPRGRLCCWAAVLGVPAPERRSRRWQSAWLCQQPPP